MIKYVDYSTGSEIAEFNIQTSEVPTEYVSKDHYTYELKYLINNVAFFIKQRINDSLENNFSYHSPKSGQPEKYNEIRNKAKDLGYLIDKLVPNSREKSLALTNLEQSVFWANAGIARNE